MFPIVATMDGKWVTAGESPFLRIYGQGDIQRYIPLFVVSDSQNDEDGNQDGNEIGQRGEGRRGWWCVE